MAGFAQVVEWLNQGLFVVLALVAAAQWRRRRGAATAWVAATFGVLAGVVVVALFLPDTGGGLWAGAARRALIAALVVFPYCLYRFAAVFESQRRRIDGIALWATTLVAVAAVAMPRYPQPGEARGWLFESFILALLAQWTLLSLFVSLRLWRAGRGKPTVARRRMRLLSLAAFLLNAAIVLAGLAPSSADPITVATVVTQLLSTTSALLFLTAFQPPGWLRLVWRRPEERALQAAQLELMAATTLPDVTERMLPPVVGVLGAMGAAVYDQDGHLQGAFPVGVTALGGLPDEHVRVPLRHGAMHVWTGTHTPFFGREELELLGAFGAVVDLAWARCLLLERERDNAERLGLVNASLEEEIAERRIALERLAMSEQRLQEAQELAHIGAWEWNADTGEVVWSDEMFRIYGLEPGHVLEYPDGFTERVHPDDREALRDAVQGSVATGEPFRLDHRILRPDGSVRIVDAQGRLVRDEEQKVSRVLGTIQDITQRREAADAVAAAYEAEREARMAFERTNEELEAFVYSVSHDLKSPIISLLGYLDYLKLDFGDALPEEAMHYVARMSASASYMEALIQDLLELSRVGRVQTESETVDLAEIATEAATERRVAHPAALVALGPLPVVEMNPLRVRQLLSNLIGNAMEHGGRPGVRIVVAGYDCADGSVRVEVTDDGDGIPPEHRDRVFGVFERLPRPGSPEGGTGIGLAICKKIMESIGGTIAAEARERGATLALHFPAAVVRRPAAAAKEMTG